MTLPRKLMIDGEQTVMTTRTHVKALLVPVIILFAVCAAGFFLIGTVWEIRWGGQPILRWALMALSFSTTVSSTLMPCLRPRRTSSI